MRRPDLVLAAIPVLAAGGLLAERFGPLLSSAVGAPVGRLPLGVLGGLGAVVVMVYALVRTPHRR